MTTGAGGKLVLLVEDEPLIREVVALELEDAGFEVVQAGDGGEAVAALASRAPDLLFTDIRLPGPLTGWDIADRARELRPALPIIYATGYADSRNRQLEGSILLTKPFYPAQVLVAVRDLGMLPRD
jgi:CheY-like chemotaxis protein